jgi:hypothetical protein
VLRVRQAGKELGAVGTQLLSCALQLRMLLQACSCEQQRWQQRCHGYQAAQLLVQRVQLSGEPAKNWALLGRSY